MRHNTHFKLVAFCKSDSSLFSGSVINRLETRVSRVLREDGGSAAREAHLDAQVLLESRGFEAKEDQMAFRGPQVHQ